MNEQELCKKRLIDLSKQADRKGIVLFSDFLNLNELNIYHQSEKMFETKTESFGGVPNAERQMVAFIPDTLYLRSGSEESLTYPIAALKIIPAYPKFAEKLGHRDILGSIMQLGVDRCKLGDIIVDDDACYILCEKSIAPYFIENLEKIRHTLVKLEKVSAAELLGKQELEEKQGIVTSNRLDAVVACVHRLSRSQALELLRSEKVFVNGKATQNPSYMCREGDIVSVRGYGRFVFQTAYGETNKGRLKIKYLVYGN